MDIEKYNNLGIEKFEMVNSYPVEYKNMIETIIPIKKIKNTIFTPTQKDTLFWCLFVIKHGIRRNSFVIQWHGVKSFLIICFPVEQKIINHIGNRYTVSIR